jgi:hypothetical protein
MGILNSNDYKRGFADGQKDAEAGKDPNYLRMGMSMKFAIHGTSSLDSYTRGYNDAYREVMRKSVVQKVEIVTKNTNNYHQTSLGNMENSQRIELQLDALRQLEQFLHETIEELHARMQTYNDRVSALRGEGLSLEIADNYDANYCIPNNQKLWQLTEQMQNTDLIYLRDNIANFEQQLEIARRNYNG